MSKNQIIVVIDGDEFKKFIKVSVSHSLDAVASGFLFSIAETEFDSKIVQNAEVKIYISTDGSNFDLVLTGKVYTIKNSYDATNHNIDVSGFSDTYDLTKATIFSNPNYATPISFVDLAGKVLIDNGILGVGVSPAFAAQKEVVVVDDLADNRTAGDIGETIYSFLDRYAKAVGVILTDNISGDLVIYDNKLKASNIRIKNKRDIFNNKVILSADYTIDYSKRFQKIIVKSQDDSENSIEAFALDGSVKSEGTLTIISENLADISGCQTQANWEVNKRRADSVKYNCKVFGFASKSDGLWKVNTAVDVDDDFAGIKSKMMIRSVRYDYSDSAGSTTDLSLTIPDAFGQKVTAIDRYNAIFGDIEEARRYEELFGIDE